VIAIARLKNNSSLKVKISTSRSINIISNLLSS
jgi:hypothetical protein